MTMGFRAALILASLYSTARGALPADACPSPSATPTTYALITPSPSAAPIPVTSHGQLITSHVPQYAVCNPDHSDCTTVYAATTYAWCSAVVPCYGHVCTVTDCAQPITFSHSASYRLATAICADPGECTVRGTRTLVAQPTTVVYVEPVVTRYVLPYTDYVGARYDAVVVERCVGEAPCEAGVERWVEQRTETEDLVVLPLTVHTYCAQPTTVTWAPGESVVVEYPSTLTWVTGTTSTRTSTL